MKRRLFNLAAAVSLLLCAAIIAGWVRGSTPAEDGTGVRELEHEPGLDLLGLELTPELGIYFIPHWMVLLVLLPLPALWSAAVVRRRLRLSREICPTCGYDLRATPDRCPECGTVRAGASTAAATTT